MHYTSNVNELFSHQRALLLPAAAGLLEDLIRVVEERDDQGEPGQVFADFCREFTIAGEERCERGRLDGANGVGLASDLRQLGDVRIAEDLEVRYNALASLRLATLDDAARRVLATAAGDRVMGPGVRAVLLQSRG